MNHGSLFSGIGGFDLAAEWAGWNNVFQVENDKFCNKILEKNFSNVKRYLDINEFDGKKYKGSIDIISGGFPCQPFSVAGKQKGAKDDRNLWPQMFRIIQEIGPTWVVAENVANITNFVEFEQACTDLENESYEVQTINIPAVGVGAWHKRERIWIIAYTSKSNGRSLQGQTTINRKKQTKINEHSHINPLISNSNQQRTQVQITGRFPIEQKFIINNAKRSPIDGKQYWATEPDVDRVVNGIPNRVDRINALGNAVVPQIPYQIFKYINEL